jgi:hypothetical protein
MLIPETTNLFVDSTNNDLKAKLNATRDEEQAVSIVNAVP